MTRRVRRVASPCLVACAMAIVRVQMMGAAQTPVAQFKTGVEATTLNVSVVDKAMKPVRGLQRDDFTVLEDGKPQRIVSFSEETLRRETPLGPVWERAFSPDVATNGGDVRRVVVILMTYSGDLYVRGKTRQIAHAIVDRLGPDDRAAVVWTQRSNDSQNFTADRAKLHAAIDRMRPGTPFPKPHCVKAFLADTLVDFPEKRKLIINIGAGSTGPSIESRMPRLVRLQGQELEDFAKSCPATPVPFAAMAQRANIVIYNIDPGGLAAGNGLGGGGVAFDTDENPTGGRTLGGTNAPERYVETVFAENDSYYVIAYESSSPKTREAFRKLDVKVNRPGVEVRAPKNWYESGPTSKELAKDPKKATPPLLKAMTPVLPDARLPLRAAVAPFAAAAGTSVASVAIALGITLPSARRGDAQEDTVDVEERAYDLEGKERAVHHQTARVTLPRGSADARLEVLSQMELKPDRYQIRMSISSALLKETASVYADLTVPDFFKEPLSLSGIAVSADVPVVSAPKDALATLIPVVPTTEREFTAGTTARVFLRVYQKGTPLPVSMEMEIRAADDTVAATERQDMAATQFGRERSADVTWRLPLATLAPGAYLVRLIAHAGAASAERSLQIVVR